MKNEVKKYVTFALLFLAGAFAQKQVGAWDWFFSQLQSIAGF